MKKALLFAFLVLTSGLLAFGQKIYWGDSVPTKWNGRWPSELRIVPEKTDYVRTTSSLELLEFIDKLKWKSDKIHVFNMYTSPLGRVCPVLVLASPRVTSPEQAAKSGKTVVYLEGNIHPYESEAKEALLLLTREILLGRMTHLLNVGNCFSAGQAECSLGVQFCLVPSSAMINRGPAACQIELKTGRKGSFHRGQAKKRRKSAGPLQPVKERITKNTQPRSQRS
jgi:hypothetical protein